jgi:hypothetical protein
MIAISIVMVAAEVVRMERGQLSLAIVRPWMVAFVFGLLHGFGFAGALVELGLPQGDIPLALLAFNVGVELGQLAFVAAVLGALLLLQHLPRWQPSALSRAMVAYGIGAVAAALLLSRIAVFVGG